MIFIIALAAAIPQSDACVKLSTSYENASKTLAILFAEGLRDNSAPRATMREQRETNVRQEARDNLDLMKANNCSLPTTAPNAGPYVLQAMQCRTDQLKNELAALHRKPTTDPISCDLSKWVNSREQ